MSTRTIAIDLDPRSQKSFKATLRNDGMATLTMLVVLFALVAFFSIVTPAGSFFSLGNIESILLNTSQLIVISLAVTFLVIGGQFDLSVGPMVVFAAVVSGWVLREIDGLSRGADGSPGNTFWLAVVASVVSAILVGAMWGFVNGLIVTKMRIQSFIATLATMGIVLGLAQVLTGGVSLTGIPREVQRNFGFGHFLGISYFVWLAGILSAIAWIVLRQTRFGMRTYAIGGNIEGARRSGINVNRHIVILFVLVGIACGLSGFLDIGRYGTASLGGHTSDALNAITAVAIGGTSLFGGRGRISGTLVGALIPSVLLSGFVIMGVQPFWQNVAVGVVLLLAVFTDQVRRGR